MPLEPPYGLPPYPGKIKVQCPTLFALILILKVRSNALFFLEPTSCTSTLAETCLMISLEKQKFFTLSHKQIKTVTVTDNIILDQNYGLQFFLKNPKKKVYFFFAKLSLTKFCSSFFFLNFFHQMVYHVVSLKQFLDV